MTGSGQRPSQDLGGASYKHEHEAAGGWTSSVPCGNHRLLGLVVITST